MKEYYLIIILFCISISTFVQEKPKDYCDAIKLIEVWLDAQKEYENLPAITTSIVSDQELTWSVTSFTNFIYAFNKINT